MEVNTKWTTNEQLQLLKEIKEGLNYDEISNIHNRSHSMIEKRLKHISLKMYQKNIDMNEIIKKTKLDNQVIIDYIHKIKNKELEKDKNEFLINYDEEKSLHLLFDDFIEESYKIKNNVYNYEKSDSGIIIHTLLSSIHTGMKNIDCILNVESLFTKKVNVGNFIICEIPKESSFIEHIYSFQKNIYLYTGYKEWVKLKMKNEYCIELENNDCKNVLIGEICCFQEIMEYTCIQKIMKPIGLQYFNQMPKSIDCINLVYARCDKSMYLLDDTHREYVNNVEFKKNDIFAIKSVAGSGKTTTLLNLAKKHSSKKILYLAFNKNLITEIKHKISTQKIKNLYPQTFDSLLYKLYTAKKGHSPSIFDLKPQTISKLIPYFEGKYFNLKKYYIKHLFKFCNQIKYNDIKTYCKEVLKDNKPLLELLWEHVEKDELITFETLRKQAFMLNWFKDYIDEHYDMIMIDETQDFDLIMLNILLNDTTIPKIFVGDPKQSIYQFRGCINAFDYLPNDSLLIEFYSTFRVGDPACKSISNEFKKCWMISKSINETQFVNEFDDDEKYVYLFRSWKILLQNASLIENIWIFNHEKKLNDIRNLHQKLLTVKKLNDDDDEFEDDLPKFLKSISAEELEDLLNKIDNNIVKQSKSKVDFYTVHSYKGMEYDNVRLAGDINILEDENIYYVAVTRGMKKIMIDKPLHNIIGKVKDMKNNTMFIDTHSEEALKTNDLYIQLSEWRTNTAKIKKIPPYCIFSNKTLLDIVRRTPKSLNELKLIHGIGQLKLQEYGDTIIEFVSSHYMIETMNEFNSEIKKK